MLIYKSNLINNIKQVKQGNPNSLVCAMVKADAYGLGAKEIVQIATEFVDYFGVACFFEAQELENFTNKKILIVGPLEKSEINERFSYACSSLDDVDFLISQDKVINTHLKVNTGMNRYGFNSFREFKKSLQKIKKSKLNFEGLFTHFATDDDYVDIQMNEFEKFVKLSKKMGFNPILHVDNSAVNKNKNHKLDMVRIGYDLLIQDDDQFKRIMEIKTQVVQVNVVKKDKLVGYNKRCVTKQTTKVAIFPVGYADGFDIRTIGMKLNFKGKECEVLNVCMDCFMLDVSKLDVKKGDELYVLNSSNSLKKYSTYMRLSPYQVMTNFSKMRAVRMVI